MSPTDAPRPAATVVVLRPRGGDADAPELFMVRRSAKSAFMPDARVFPGGKVDAADGPAGSDEAFAAAARRECAEESQIALAPGALRWFDTWITPHGEPRRFHARFYVARLAAGEGGDAAADGHETHEGAWATAAEVLAEWEAGAIDLPPPTACTLLRLASPGWASIFTWPREQVEAPILPKWIFAGGRLEVVLPHDPGYAELPGEGVPPCARLEGLPRRFIRDGSVWRPEG